MQVLKILATIFVLLITGGIILEYIPLWKASSQSMTLLYSEREIFIYATVSATQPFLAAGTQVTVHAFGSIGRASFGSGFALANVTTSTLYENIFYVCVLFSGAYQVVGGRIFTNMNPAPSAGACLGLTNTRPSESYNLTEWMQFGPGGAFLAPDSATIEWSSPMESVPSILIQYTSFLTIDGVVRNSISQDYSSKAVHVESQSTLDIVKTETKGFVIAAMWSIYGLVSFLPSRIKRKASTVNMRRTPLRGRVTRQKPDTQQSRSKTRHSQ